VWLAKTCAETKDGKVLGKADVDTTIASIRHEDSGGHRTECKLQSESCRKD